MKLDDWKTISEIVASWVAIVGLSCAGVFAIIEYLDHKEEVRIERTLKFASEFGSAHLLDSRVTLNEIWVQHYPAVIDILTKREDQNEINRKYSEFVNRVIEERGLQADMAKVMEFLEGFAVCVESALCDESMARSFVGPYGRGFFRTYYPYICKLRKTRNDESIGAKLERFYSGTSTGPLCS
jgi:phosphate/sulfate permease